MFIGIDLGTTTSSGAYMCTDGSVDQIINERLPEITPRNLRYWFWGCDNLSDADKALKELTEIIAEMKNSAEIFSPEKIDSACVCIPANLPANTDGRKLIENAIWLAGIKHIEMIKEAVAVIYAYDNAYLAEGDIALVYDFGGKNFTATLIQKKKNDRLAVLAEKTVICGGDELDMPLLEDATHVMEQNLAVLEIVRDDEKYQKAWAQFDAGVGRMKRQLSRCGRADLVFRNPFLKVTCEYPWERFEPILSQLYQKTEAVVAETILAADIQKKDIAQVFLAGGSSHFPYIREQLEAYIGKRPCVRKDMTAASAIGAAIYAVEHIEKGKSMKDGD